jgi:Flp pilus assembly protein TadD
MDPRDAESRYALATAYLALGHRAEATNEYTALCQLDGPLATKLYHLLAAR